jgi:hypothetical protein
VAPTPATSAKPAERPHVPEPESTVAPPLDEVTANGPAVQGIAPAVPVAEYGAGPAGDDEPTEITPEEKAAIATLISQAAIADGFKGKGYVRAWLQTHYQIDVSDVAEIPRTILAQIRAHAFRVSRRRALQETPAPNTSSIVPSPPTPAGGGGLGSPNRSEELYRTSSDLDDPPQ